MAGKEVSDFLPESEKDDEDGSPLTKLAPWQNAWLRRHRYELVRRMPTILVVDRLIQRGAIHADMDAYQEIIACRLENYHQRARLLLDYIASQTRKIFWDFQAALISAYGCDDMAIRQEDATPEVESFSEITHAQPMVGKEMPTLPVFEFEKDNEESWGLAPWQHAWLSRHRNELIRRMPTMDVVDRLIQRGAIDTDMDAYQEIRACHELLINERARLLLKFVALQTVKIFWDFQAALILEGCGDLAVRREDATTMMESFSAAELADSSRRTNPAHAYASRKSRSLN